MTHVYLAPEKGGYFSARSDHLRSFGFRWHEAGSPGVYSVTIEKSAMDEGKPAKLMRSFDAVCDDFGTLVEVAS